MCMGQNPVDLLIGNFPNFDKCGIVKFWTNSSPKLRWFVDHQLTLPKACHFPNMCMGLKPVDPLIDNFDHFPNSGNSNFEPIALQNGVDHQLTLSKAFHFQNMCMGQNPVDPLIVNFGDLANSGKVKFWTSSSPKQCWFVDHQYGNYLRLSFSKFPSWDIYCFK